jgi:hypothetical protein
MDPVTMLTIGMGVAKMGQGIAQNVKANQIQNRNIRPEYEIPEEYYENVAAAEQLAQRGFDEDSLSRQNNMALRGLSATLSAGLQMGMNPNQVGDYYSQYLDQMGDIAVKDIQLKFGNIDRMMQTRDALANQKFIQFGYNEDAPYKDRAQLATTMKQQATQNIMGGIDTAVGGFVAGEQRELYDRQIAVQEKALGLGNLPTIDRGTTVNLSNPDLSGTPYPARVPQPIQLYPNYPTGGGNPVYSADTPYPARVPNGSFNRVASTTIPSTVARPDPGGNPFDRFQQHMTNYLQNIGVKI